MSIDCLSMLLNNYNKPTFRVVPGAGVCVSEEFVANIEKSGHILFQYIDLKQYNSNCGLAVCVEYSRQS